MLDLRFIRENSDAVKKNVAARHVAADVDAVVTLYDTRNTTIQELERLRAERNDVANRMKGRLEQTERDALIEHGKLLKARIPELESELKETEARLSEEASRIPNMSHPDAPFGVGDESNTEIKRSGTPREFSFPAKDHLELGTALDLIDFETATRVSGTKFYYLKNEAVVLELALVRFALDIVTSHGFTAMITPDIARESVLAGIGYNPRGEESNIYTLEGDEGCLVGTAEITLGGYHMGEILEPDRLPIKYTGLSHCFRREAGAAGQFSKGLYRVHQFSKLEMFVFCRPEDSAALLETLLAIEEQIFTDLEIPYRVVDTCTGDLGGPAYRKYDIEAWMPGRGDGGSYGEVTSCSNCTDYQARRLGVRYRTTDGKREFVHMLNGTAIAVSRGLIALLENHQNEDNSITIPEKLARYTGFTRIGPRTAGGPG